jgi:hypothetical protein
MNAFSGPYAFGPDKFEKCGNLPLDFDDIFIL